MAKHEVQFEIDGEEVFPKTKANYQVYKFPYPLTLGPSLTSINKELTITTTGNPVMLSVCGDINPVGTTNCHIVVNFYRNGIHIARQLAEGRGQDSYNHAFSLQQLDVVSEGTYVYKCELIRGAGEFQLTENGAMESPQFSIFEI